MKYSLTWRPKEIEIFTPFKLDGIAYPTLKPVSTFFFLLK